MKDKLFCRKCGFRIWRHSDKRPRVDTYFENMHFWCESSLWARPPLLADETPDLSYAEREVPGEEKEKDHARSV